MLATFDPSIAENYASMFAQSTSSIKFKQDRLQFTEPAHYDAGVLTVEAAQESMTDTNIEQHMLGFSEPVHYAS